MKQRIYICHTFYHVYIAHLKEFYIRQLSDKKEESEADILLSTMSNDFGELGVRMQNLGFFRKVLPFYEKDYTKYPDLLPLKKESNQVILNLWKRIIFTKKLGQKTEELIPVDLKSYDDIYVFCDSDPIGYYLNYKRIHYHAVEDGLDTLKSCDGARYDNRGFFGLKRVMAALNLIFIQDGYSKYCLDMEVNDISCLLYPIKKNIELSRNFLADRLTTSEKEILLASFLPDYENLYNALQECKKDWGNVLILTEPLCTLDIREQIFKDLIEKYGENKNIFLKQHPRDELCYEEKFPDQIILSKQFPMEMLNFIPGIQFELVISVFTELGALNFGTHKLRLGPDFMDHYEDPLIHRQNEQI